MNRKTIRSQYSNQRKKKNYIVKKNKQLGTFRYATSRTRQDRKYLSVANLLRNQKIIFSRNRQTVKKIGISLTQNKRKIFLFTSKQLKVFLKSRGSWRKWKENLYFGKRNHFQWKLRRYFSKPRLGQRKTISVLRKFLRKAVVQKRKKSNKLFSKKPFGRQKKQHPVLKKVHSARLHRIYRFWKRKYYKGKRIRRKKAKPGKKLRRRRSKRFSKQSKKKRKKKNIWRNRLLRPSLRKYREMRRLNFWTTRVQASSAEWHWINMHNRLFHIKRINLRKLKSFVGKNEKFFSWWILPNYSIHGKIKNTPFKFKRSVNQTPHNLKRVKRTSINKNQIPLFLHSIKPKVSSLFLVKKKLISKHQKKMLSQKKRKTEKRPILKANNIISPSFQKKKGFLSDHIRYFSSMALKFVERRKKFDFKAWKKLKKQKIKAKLKQSSAVKQVRTKSVGLQLKKKKKNLRKAYFQKSRFQKKKKFRFRRRGHRNWTFRFPRWKKYYRNFWRYNQQIHKFDWMQQEIYSYRQYRRIHQIYRRRNPRKSKNNNWLRRLGFVSRTSSVRKRQGRLVNRLMQFKLFSKFYGPFSTKQLMNRAKHFQRIDPWKNTKKMVSWNWYEQRIDVTTFRLGLAPSLKVAQILVEQGYIFVNGQQVISLQHRVYPWDQVAVTPYAKLRFQFHWYWLVRNQYKRYLYKNKKGRSKAVHPQKLTTPFGFRTRLSLERDLPRQDQIQVKEMERLLLWK